MRVRARMRGLAIGVSEVVGFAGWDSTAGRARLRFLQSQSWRGIWDDHRDGSGDEELSARAADLAARLPEALAPLARIAFNYRWAWYPRGKEVFRAVDRSPLGGLRRESCPPASGGVE